MTSTVTYHCGDVRDVMASLEPGSVDFLVTSPPFLALRSYLPADHVDKHREIGSEATPAAFLDTMTGLTADWRRLLPAWGSIAVEIGDTYSGSGGAGGDYLPGGLREDQPMFRQAYGGGDNRVGTDAYPGGFTGRRGHGTGGGTGWPLAKSLCMTPQLYGIALAYGINPLTGQPSPAGRWRVRNWMTWTRPNPPVGALGDKFRPATSHVTVACTDSQRWFDLDAVRGENPRVAEDPGGYRMIGGVPTHDAGPRSQNPAGAPPLDWWDANDTPNNDWQPLHRLTTQPYKGSHYAAFPVALPQRLIEAMCPREVCRQCGEPRRRITGAYTLDAYRSSDRTQTIRAVSLADAAGLTDEHVAAVRAFGTSDAGKATTLNNGAGKNSDNVKRLAAEAKAVLGGYFREFVMGTNASPGSTWTDCGHNQYRPGIVLDCFGGSGTTALAAALCGRDAVLIDIDHRNIDLTRQRLGERLLIVNETADGNTTTWTVDPHMPGTKGQAEGQLSMFEDGAA